MSAVTAAPAVQARLLELQELDSALRRARARLQRIRADEDLRARQAEVQEAEALLAERTAEARTADAAAASASEKAAATRTRRDRTRDRLAGGQGGSRDLIGLQHEAQTLEALLSQHDDAALAAMQVADDAERAVGAAARALEDSRGRLAERTAQLRRTGAEVTAEGRDLTTRRAALAAELPALLVALYEQARDANGGIGAARLQGRRSAASGTELSPAEVAVITALPPDAVARCPETGALLIRG